MKTYVIKVMDVYIQLTNIRYSLLETRIQQYVVTEYPRIDFEISLSDEELIRGQDKLPQIDVEELEYLMTGTLFVRHIIDYDAFLIHSSSVVVNNLAYSFSGNSGMGKSTHTKLYLANFPESFIINDDKPIYRLNDDDTFEVYGNPWSGKDDISKNTSAKLQGLCFIERGFDNKVTRLTNKDAIGRILNQTYRPQDENRMSHLLHLLDKFVTNVPVYEIHCDISKNAVMSSYKNMNKKGE